MARASTRFGCLADQVLADAPGAGQFVGSLYDYVTGVAIA